MKFNVFGNKDNPVVLLLHPLFYDWKIFEKIIDKMKKKYYLIVPTLDGHYNGSIYKSKENEIKQISKYLEENNINFIKYLVGVSMGANIAFDFFCKNPNKVEHVIMDGISFFHVKKIFIHIYSFFYSIFVNWTKKSPFQAEKFLNFKFKNHGKLMVNIICSMNLKSMIGFMDTCYNCSFPYLNVKNQNKLTFIFGTREISKLCIKNIKKYKFANIIKKRGYNHCGYIILNPDGYVNLLESLN